MDGPPHVCEFTPTHLKIQCSREPTIMIPNFFLVGASISYPCVLYPVCHVFYYHRHVIHSRPLRCVSQAVAEDYVAKIRLAVLGGKKPPKALLLVNPCAGKGKAEQVLRKDLLPILRSAGVIVQVEKTQRVGHGEEIVARHEDLAEFDIIGVVGGDGVVHEVANGLLSRADHTSHLKRGLSIIAFPTGSGNALASSVGITTTADALWAVVKHHIRHIDIMAYWQNDKRRFGLLNFLFGYVSDIDFLSERFRFLGEARFTVQAVWEIINHRHFRYPAKIELLKSKSASKPVACSGTINCEKCDVASSSRFIEQELPVVPPSRKSATDPDKEWETIEDGFSFFVCQNTSRLTASNLTCPYAHLSDGCVDLCFVRDAKAPSRMDLFKLSLAMDSGEHVKQPKVEYHKAFAVRVTPLYKTGNFGIDGERIPNSELSLQVVRGFLPVLGLPEEPQGTDLTLVGVERKWPIAQILFAVGGLTTCLITIGSALWFAQAVGIFRQFGAGNSDTPQSPLDV